MNREIKIGMAYKIIWEDSFGVSGWNSIEECKKEFNNRDANVITYGICIAERKNHYLFASSYCLTDKEDEKLFDNMMAIYKPSIKKIELIK